MASSTPKRRSIQAGARVADTSEDVAPDWIIKALALSLLAAVVLAYASVCLLIYLGGAGGAIHPRTTIDRTPAAESIPFESIRFDAAELGRPRLTGWWIPSAGAGSSVTILYLHGPSGSLGDSVHAFALLHEAQVNVFAIDYRGFGESDPTHPNQARMEEDSVAALEYLLQERHLSSSAIIPYGAGLGGYLAAKVMERHPELPALILDNPQPRSFVPAEQSGRARFLPMRVLVRDSFELAEPLASLEGPKLLIAGGPNSSQAQPDESVTRLLRQAPDPKMTVTITSAQAEVQFVEGIRRFLDEYVQSELRPKENR